MKPFSKTSEPCYALDRAPRRRACWSRHRGRGAQSLVEFSLLAPLFFMVLFGVVDGGLLLFEQNAVDNAATVGADALAAYGRQGNADFVSLNKMAQAGFGAYGLAKLGEVDVEALTPDPVFGFQDNADGTPKVLNTCGGGGNQACIDKYQITDNGGGNITIQALNGNPVCTYPTTCPIAPCADASGCVPWPPDSRNVSNGTSSYSALVVTYTYTFFTGVQPPITLKAIKTFRLEPQTA